MSGRGYQRLEFTDEFLDSYASREFTSTDRGLVKKALRLLEENERHPSLRVHQLQGPLRGIWSASASDDLRLTLLRLEGGRKRLLTCSRHYKP